MVKHKKIDGYFKRKAPKEIQSNTTACVDAPSCLQEESQPLKVQRAITDGIDVNSLERDPGKRPQIWEYPANQKDEIRRAYLKWGPYQIQLESYPFSGEKHPRRFQYTWFKMFPSWLEYSPTSDGAYCLPCYLFSQKPSGRPGSDAFIRVGFRTWKKVNAGKYCTFLNHIGDSPRSPHNNAVKACQDLLNQSMHMRNIINVQSLEQVTKNRLRLKTSIDTIRWLTFQSCAFRGHDETPESKNRGNFLEMIKLLASYNDNVAKVVLENAPYNSKYTSHHIQKEILHIFSRKVRSHIREEIGDSKFCIIVDEARDESKREQMAIVLRFVDKNGHIKERFFDLVHVKDTTATTLKRELCDVFSRYDLDVSNIRGQGYDGASNMRGEWNGLQALFLNDNPYAYYVHCFAHRLQLALIVASREVIPIHQFFSNLTFIVNIICSSSKRHDQLQDAELDEISHLLEIGELETGKGKNQIGTLKRAGDTRWSSHFQSICSMMRRYNPVCFVLQSIIVDGSTYSQKGDADSAYNILSSFEFILILHMMRKIMGITDCLCQALQQKSQDILNAIQLVHTTKLLIQELRDDGWQDLLNDVRLFCEQHDIEVLDLSATYIARNGRSRRQTDSITREHHFRVNIFLVAIDKQLQELNGRFSEQTMELMTLSSALVPKDSYKAFNVGDICTLVNRFYPSDFNEQEKINLSFQLQHFILEAPNHPNLKNLSTIPELCQSLASTGKATTFHLIDRLIRRILTLPISTATIERSFSAMKMIKTKLRNKMEDDFLADNMIIYIEKEIAETITSDSIIEDFKHLKERRALL